MQDPNDPKHQTATWLGNDREHFAACHKRWVSRMRRSDQEQELNSACDNPRQCGSCAYYVPPTAAFASDWGACTNAASPCDRRAMFEHDGCEHHMETGWNQGQDDLDDKFANGGVAVTSLYRCGVLLPANQHTADHLSSGWVHSARDVKRWVELTHAVRNVWWPHGVFAALNAACGCSIDEHETDIIPPAKLGLAAEILARYLPRFDADAGVAAKQVIELCREAEQHALPLIWVL